MVRRSLVFLTVLSVMVGILVGSVGARTLTVPENCTTDTPHADSCTLTGNVTEEGEGTTDFDATEYCSTAVMSVCDTTVKRQSPVTDEGALGDKQPTVSSESGEDSGNQVSRRSGPGLRER
jgi:hypothetical protein